MECTTTKLIHLKMDKDDGGNDDMDNINFHIGILNPSICRRRREIEHTDFHVRKSLSMLEERLMTVLENCLVQIDLLAALPFLSQHLAEYEEEKQWKENAYREGKRQERREHRKEEKCILPNILGRDSIRALYRLFTATQKQTHNKTAQMTKYGEKIQSGSISSSFSSSSASTSSHHGQYNQNNINRSEEEEEEKQDRKNQNSHPVHESQKKQKNTSTSFSFYDASNISKWETDRKIKKQEKNKQSNLEKRQQRKNQLISMLEKKDDVSQLKFLSSLLQGSEDEKEDDNVGGSITLSRVDDSALCTKESDGEHDNKIKGEEEEKEKKMRMKRNILRQIRAALGSKYGDHVKKALEDKDKRSLLCMLALLPQSAVETQGDKSTEKGKDEIEKKHKNKHKTTCRKYNKKKQDQNVEGSRTTLHKKQQKDDKDGEEYYEDENDEESFGLRLIMIEDESKIRRFDSQNSSRLSSSSINNRDNSRLLSSSTSSSTCFLSPNDDVDNDNYDFPDDDDSSSSSSSFLLNSDMWARNDDDDDVEIVEEEEEDDRESIDISQDVEDGDNVEIGQSEPQLEVLKIPLDDYSFLPFVTKSISSSSSSASDSTEQRQSNEANKKNVPMNLTQYPDIPEERTENLSITDEIDDDQDVKNSSGEDETIKESTRLELQSETVNKFQKTTAPLQLVMKKNSQEEKLKRAIRGVFQHLSMDPKYFRYRLETSLLDKNCLKPQTKLEEDFTTNEKEVQNVWTCTEGLQNFRKYFHALVLLMRDRLATSLEERIQRNHKLMETWKSEKRALKQLQGLHLELKRLEDVHVPKMLTLDFQIRILNSRLHQVSKENFGSIREVIRETELSAAVESKHEITIVEKAEQAAIKREEIKVTLRSHTQVEELKMKNKREEFDLKLRQEIERYDDRLFKLQDHLDDIIEEKFENEKKVAAIQRKFEHVEDRFINMRGAKKLQQIMKNREIADDFKRNRAAKLIQDVWKRYKARKRRRERKGKKKGKKKKKK